MSFVIPLSVCTVCRGSSGVCGLECGEAGNEAKYCSSPFSPLVSFSLSRSISLSSSLLFFSFFVSFPFVFFFFFLFLFFQDSGKDCPNERESLERQMERSDEYKGANNNVKK